MTDNAKPGFFSKQKPDNSYKEIPKPKSAFTSDNTDLLENIHPEEDVLKINNKSLGIGSIRDFYCFKSNCEKQIVLDFQISPFALMNLSARTTADFLKKF